MAFSGEHGASYWWGRRCSLQNKSWHFRWSAWPRVGSNNHCSERFSANSRWQAPVLPLFPVSLLSVPSWEHWWISILFPTKWHWMVAKLLEGGDGWAELKELFSILSPPKYVFVHVVASPDWMNPQTLHVQTRIPPLFFPKPSGTRWSAPFTWHGANTAGSSAECKDRNQTINQKSLSYSPAHVLSLMLFFFFISICTPCKCHSAAQYVWHGCTVNLASKQATFKLSPNQTPCFQCKYSVTSARLWRCYRNHRHVTTAPWRHPQ